jgi:hypothetical protein
MKLKVRCTIENNKITSNLRLFLDVLSHFNGKEVLITIQPYKKLRSSPQNRYYFGVVCKLIKDAIKTEWGQVVSIDDTHAFLKSKLHFKEFINENTGEIANLPLTTTEDSTAEFMEYLESCRNFGKEWFNIDIPEPNEQINLEL